MNEALLVLALLPLAGALLPALAHRAARLDPALVAGAIAATALALVLWLAPAALDGGTHVARWPWVPALGLEFALRWDGLSFLFALLITGIGTLIVAYARWYLHGDEASPRFYGLLLLFMGAMLGIVLAENVILLVVSWELTSISSFLLIGYRSWKDESRQGARLALLVTGAGGLALLAGALLLGEIAGTYSLSGILAAGDVVRAHPLYTVVLVLVLLGAFTKSAQFPFHFWLPHAMAAPTPVSAYLHSATMVKAGIFLMMRMYPALGGTDQWFWIVSSAGAATLLLGSVVAFAKHDLKGLLAYSTVSHLGLVTMLLGLSTVHSEIAAVFHVINHAVFKASLFMAAGIVDHGTGSRDMRKLSGLARWMPYTASLAIVAAGAMAGVPLLNGFLSKEMFFAETLVVRQLGDFSLLVPFVATLAGIFTVAYSVRFVHDVFFDGPPQGLPHEPHEAPRWMRVPIEVLVALCLVIGLAPALTVEPLLRAASLAVLQRPLPDFHLAIWHGFNVPLFMSLVAMLGGVALYVARRARGTLHAERRGPIQAKPLVEGLLDGLYLGARSFWPAFDGQSLQRYVLLLVFAAVAAGAFGYAGSPLAGARPWLPVTPVAAIGAVLLVLATLATVHWHRRRALAVVLVGIVGLVVSLAFAQFSAPDLALTQLLVEIVTILLLLLALYFLPAETPAEPGAARHLRDGALAIAAGAGVAALAYAAMTRPVSTISGYYTATAPGPGGGYNVVNVILVDFRGFDTLGEITVLGIAALAIAGMLRGLELPAPDRDWRGRPWSPRHESLPLEVVARPLLPLALLVSVYLLLRGHNAPGGGFIAGLVAAVAIFIQYIAYGAAALHERLPFDYARTVALGLAIALATGLGSFFFDHPFLTSSTPRLDWPVVGEWKLATATFFDVGVFLVVVGTILLILARLAAMNRPERAGAADAAGGER